MASLTRGIITAAITVVIMSVVAVFIAGGNAWFGITPGTLVMMFTYTYTVTNQSTSSTMACSASTARSATRPA